MLQHSVIIVGDTDKFHLWVASELQDYLLKLSGIVFPVSTSTELPVNKSFIVLGNPQSNPLIASAQKQGLVDFTGLKSEGFILKMLELNNIPAVVLGGNDDRGKGDRSFDFLGFTHYKGLSRKGKPVLKRKTRRYID
jgi:hypothetical protein